MTSEIKVDTISEQTSANGVTIDGLTIKDGNIIGDVALAGTTPTFTIGDAGAEDASLIFDGNAQDFYIALDDSADDLVIGTGSTIGSNAKMVIENGGNVGIGTVSSSTKLTIDEGGEPPAEGMLLLQANSSTRQLRIQPPTNADNGFIDYRGGNLVFMDDGTEVFRFQGSSEVVVNDPSNDMDFRVESNGNTHMLFVDGGNDDVRIGTATSFGPHDAGLKVKGDITIGDFTADSASATLGFVKSRNTTVGSQTIVADDDEIGRIAFRADDGNDANYNNNVAAIAVQIDAAPGTNDTAGRILFETTADGARVGTERMRINSDGDVLAGKTATSVANVGIELHHDNYLGATRDDNPSGYFNRKSGDGDIVEFRKDNSTIGYIGTGNSGDLYIGNDDTGLMFAGGSDAIMPTNKTSLRDDVINLGHPSYRFDDIYATNGTIQTSDRNEKQDEANLTAAEIKVAVAAKGLLKKYRWKNAVAKKGDDARIHFGIIAQDLQDAFTAEGLDAGNYGMFILNTWWEKEISVPAKAADENVDTNTQDAYTYKDHKDEETEGYTKRTRLGVRYDQVLAFIIAGI